jgi:hypothetical protein
MNFKICPLIFFILIAKCIFAQEYAPFEVPVKAIVNSERIIIDQNGEKCILPAKSEIKILGRGYNKNKENYWFKSDECTGFINSTWFTGGIGFNYQDREAAKDIYKIKNDQALKEIKEEKETALLTNEKDFNILKKECSYLINEFDIFDKVKVIRTKPKAISEGLYIMFYAKGTQKNVIFSAIDLGCTSPYKNNRSWVKVMLKNEDVLTFYHSGQLECGGFELWGNISSSEISRLKQSPIKAIKLEGTEYNHTITDFDWPTFFIDQLKCYNPL